MRYQCPFRFLFISTDKSWCSCWFTGSVSIPIRASLHFHNGSKKIAIPTFCVSMPIRASLHFHIAELILSSIIVPTICVNAHSGFSSFPQHPSESRRNKAFSRPFLQVFIWKFWKQEFSEPFLFCSQFVHILQYSRNSRSCFCNTTFFQKGL